MKNPVWANAIKSCADPQRANHFFDLLAATSIGEVLKVSSVEQARILAALFSGSRPSATYSSRSLIGLVCWSRSAQVPAAQTRAAQ